MSDRDFDWLLQVGKSKRVSAGTVLITEGQPTDALYIVLEGDLGVSVEALGDEEVARLGSGEVVGEMSFVDARPPSATVKAVEDAVVWSIPRSQLSTKLSQDVAFSSHFYQSIAAFLSDRLRSTVNRFGYNKEQIADGSEFDDEPNPQMSSNLELAQVRLNWLLDRMKTTF